MYLLDTNSCIRYLNGRSPGIMYRLQGLKPFEVAVCSVVKAELFYGANKSHNPSVTLAKQLNFLNQFYCYPFDDHAA
jgi:tRNA(fMet)-specific endonuclease VapC